jgi:hypothetical protein
MKGTLAHCKSTYKAALNEILATIFGIESSQISIECQTNDQSSSLLSPIPNEVDNNNSKLSILVDVSLYTQHQYQSILNQVFETNHAISDQKIQKFERLINKKLVSTYQITNSVTMETVRIA